MPSPLKVLLSPAAGPAARWELADYAATRICDVVAANPSACLGTATGSTMTPVYQALGSCRRSRGLSFAAVRGFQLDEYCLPVSAYPRAAGEVDSRSFRAYLHRHLGAAGLPLPNIHVLPTESEDPAKTCAEWEARLQRQRLRLQLLGIGVEGHIAFVEAGAPGATELRNSRTARVALCPSTRLQCQRDFAPQPAPTHAFSVGIGTLLAYADEFLLLAFGASKAEAVYAALLGPVDDRCPAAYLREAQVPVTVLLDQEAAALFLSATQGGRHLPAHLQLHPLPQRAARTPVSPSWESLQDVGIGSAT